MTPLHFPPNPRPILVPTTLGRVVAGLFLAVLMGACNYSSPTEPLISRVEPVHGSTAVDRQLQPFIELAAGASWNIDPQAPQLLLYDVTGGAQLRLGGRLTIEGQRITFAPTSDLQQGHDFEFVLERSGVNGLCATGTACNNDELTENDGSEWPQEKIAWPLRLRFSTTSKPQVRAVYMDDQTRVHVLFSQPMDAVVTSAMFALFDQRNQPVLLEPAVWTDVAQKTARLRIAAQLEPVELYTLQVKREAQAGDGTRLDGNRNGNPGEIDDDFTLQFTGSQRPVVQSRLPE